MQNINEVNDWVPSYMEKLIQKQEDNISMDIMDGP